MPNENLTVMQPVNGLQKFEEARGLIAKLTEQCKNIVISDDSTLASAEKLAKDAKSVEKKIEEKRIELKAPYLQEGKRIDDVAKSLTNDLNAAVKGLRDGILKFKQEQERKRQEELKRIEEEKRKAEEAAKAVQEALASQNPNNIPPVPVTTPDIAELDRQAKALSKEAPKGIRKTWAHEITDINAIPREYMMPDTAKIKQAIAEGIREIPGIRIYQEENLILR